jgi:hypothetical protein
MRSPRPVKVIQTLDARNPSGVRRGMLARLDLDFCCTLGISLASFSASLFWATVFTGPLSTSVPFLAE